METFQEMRIRKEIDDYLINTSNTVEKGNMFLKWILINIFDKTDNELDDNDIETGVVMTDGSSDKGIDAVFINKGSLFIIQSKYNTSHTIDGVHAFISKMTDLLNKDENSWGNKINFIYDFIFNKDDINDIQFFYITDNEVEVNIFDNKIDIFEDVMPQNCKKNCRMRIMGIKGIIKYIEELTNSVPAAFKGCKTSLLMENFFENNEHTTTVAEVAIKNLASFIKKSKDYLYYSNIRNFLGKGVKINKEIVKTFQEYPKNFWLYNNGITIVCDDYKIKSQNKLNQLEIITPQIVNGCQTANVIFTEWSAIKDKQEKNDLEGTILVKVIKDTNGKRSDITRFTNSQNTVSGKDFFALDFFQKKLKKEFEKIGYNYEIQRNATLLKEQKNKIKGNAKYSYLFDKQFSKKNTIIAKEAIQAYASGVLLYPAKAKSIGNFIPGGQYYDITFNDKTPIDPRVYLFPFSIMYYGNNILGHKKDNRQKASNLLFISIYFRLIYNILKKGNLVNENPDGDVIVDDLLIESIDKIFSNEVLNVELISKADEILNERIFDDTAIKELIEDNLPKFLKSTIESSKCVKIIEDKVLGVINKPNFQSRIEQIIGIF